VDIALYFIDLLANFDEHLAHWCAAYGPWAVAILALIVFAETGFFFFPFLPGDSMLFIVGVFCGTALLDFRLIAPVLVLCAVLGDAVNFAIGKHCGAALLRRFPGLRGGHRHASGYFARHGARTIVIARFVPVLRGFAPFAAGFSRMEGGVFTRYNVVGASLWVVVLMGLGYVFGDMAIVRQNLSKAILAIVALSLLPLAIARFRRRTPAATSTG
jgi:membrane-associated protein